MERGKSLLVKLLILFTIVWAIQSGKTDVWLDCDPGIDDAFGIILAGLHPELNLVGVSSSAGNTHIDDTTTNVANILYSIGRQDVPVYKGTSKHISKMLSDTATHIHGEGGIGGVQLDKSPIPVIEEDSFKKIVDKIMSRENKITIIIVGSHTNWCIILRDFPEVRSKI